MNKKLTIAALALLTLASCTDNEFVGETNTATNTAETQPISFGFNMQNTTRADIVGNAAADLLGSGFYVVGTKGKEGTDNPSTKLVFDNYLVYNKANTAGTTESNTANWEYVGVTPGSGDYTKWVKLSSLSSQTIKYWDYSEEQYDFHAFSTGTFNAVTHNDLKKETATTDDDVDDSEIGVTAMKYGENLKNSTTAYTFYIPTIDALKNVYITDITPVKKADYNKEVQLTFKNLGSKIRLALYETVPGYSIQASSVKFYTVDNDAIKSGDTGYETPTATAALISADAVNGFSTKGTVTVTFPNIGTGSATNGNYNKASVSVNPVAPVAPATPALSKEFGGLDNLVVKEKDETTSDNKLYIGRNITEATFAGTPELGYYQLVFPVTVSSPLTLRVDYTLISTDGSGETINIYGAKAVVPATYTVWQPNYAYTYIFKISDNTNGWTSTDKAAPGLFPITFDAVVAEIKDVTGEQTTVTTVATPSITTYQQNHDPLKPQNEYSKATNKNVYVQVMDNNTPKKAALVGFGESGLYKLNETTTDDTPTNRSLLYAVTGTTTASEALVMDALENQSTVVSNVITGRNGVILTPKASNIDATVETIVNGADDQPIDLRDKDNNGDRIANSGKGKAAKINIASLDAGTYAYVYDYSDAKKTTKTFYQPTGVTSGTIANDKKYITTTALAGINDVTTGSEKADDAYVYFSKTTDGTNTTYSYYSVDGKTENLPAGLLKVSKTSGLSTSTGSVSADADTFVFDVYTRNTGKYAVKIIKIED